MARIVGADGGRRGHHGGAEDDEYLIPTRPAPTGRGLEHWRKVVSGEPPVSLLDPAKIPELAADLAAARGRAVLPENVDRLGGLSDARPSSLVRGDVLDDHHSPVIENRRPDQRLGRRGDSGCALSPYARGCCAQRDRQESLPHGSVVTQPRGRLPLCH